MCRFIAYHGHPVILEDILIKPKNSLIHQSIHALETEHPLNGDGIGLGWYVRDIDDTPAIFRSVRPAWNEPNFMNLCPKIRSDCVFAHVRAANVGAVTHYNCHPFSYKNYMFMHNGCIYGFDKIKRPLRRSLCDEAYMWIKGQTDSEHMFALFVHNCIVNNVNLECDETAEVFVETINQIHRMKADAGIEDEPTYINAVMTDGAIMMAFRYVSDPSYPSRSLYYSAGKQYVYHDEHCHMEPTEGKNGAVLIVSEKLTSYVAEWHEIPSQHYLTVAKDLSTSLNAINLSQ